MPDKKTKIKNWTRLQTKIGKKAIFPLVILGLLSSLIAVGMAWVIAEIIGKILVPSIPIQFPISILILFYLLLSLLKGCVFFLEGDFTIKIGLKARHRLRNLIINHIMQIGPSILRRQSSGALTALAVDQVESLDGYFSRWLPASVLWIASPLLILFFVYLVQPWSALIMGLCGLMVPIAQVIFGIGAAMAARKQFLAMTRLQAQFLDRVRGIATIVLAGRSDDMANRLALSADELRKRTMKILRVAFLSSASIDCAMIIAIILVVLMDGSQFVQIHSIQSIPVTHILFTLLIIPEFFGPLRSLALAYQDRARLGGTAASIVELPVKNEFSTNVKDIPFNDKVEISFKNVSYHWDAQRGRILHSLNFDIKAGERALLIGQSGAGKSTIIEMILGFIKPNEGQVLVNGLDITEYSAASLSKLMAWIGQKPVIFCGTIRENIMFARPSSTEQEFQQAIEAAAIDRYLLDLPHGFDTVIGENGYGLSGGQAQRIAIARAYLKNAPLLLLDEPTAHLDPETERDIFNQLLKLTENRTVIMATHSEQGQKLPGIHINLNHGFIISCQKEG